LNKLIDNGNYTMRLQVSKLDLPLDYFWVSFTSELATAKKPKDQQTLFTTLLDRTQFTKLRDLIDLQLLETT